MNEEQRQYLRCKLWCDVYTAETVKGGINPAAPARSALADFDARFPPAPHPTYVKPYYPPSHGPDYEPPMTYLHDYARKVKSETKTGYEMEVDNAKKGILEASYDQIYGIISSAIRLNIALYNQMDPNPFLFKLRKSLEGVWGSNVPDLLPANPAERRAMDLSRKAPNSPVGASEKEKG